MFASTVFLLELLLMLIIFDPVIGTCCGDVVDCVVVGCFLNDEVAGIVSGGRSTGFFFIPVVNGGGACLAVCGACGVTERGGLTFKEEEEDDDDDDFLNVDDVDDDAMFF